MASSSSISHLLHADPAHQYPSQPVSNANAASLVTTPGNYTYPAPPSTASPAASGASQPTPVATPVTSPGARSTGGVSTHGRTDTTTAPRGHAANASLYQCADCLKRYSRPEHLQRHIATHTLGKRFICDVCYCFQPNLKLMTLQITGISVLTSWSIQVCGKAFGRADLLKRHRANHDDDGNGTKRRRINSSPGAGRVAHACQACAKARVKCEEVKPCSRCRNRNLACEYASSEAGSAAAMHLLHLSANAHSSAATTAATPVTIAPMTSSSVHGAVTESHSLGPEPIPSHTAQPGHTQGFRTTQSAAPAVTNAAHSRSAGSSPSILINHPPMNNEAAAQLPTPETMVDQSELPCRSVAYFGIKFVLAYLLYYELPQRLHILSLVFVFVYRDAVVYIPLTVYTIEYLSCLDL